MATNYWQFGELSEPNQRVHEVNNVSLEKRFEQLIDMATSLITDKKQSFKACGICTMTDHPTDYCPCLQVYGVGNFPGPPQMPYDPYGDTYNSGWQDHPNCSYAQDPWLYPTYQPYEPPNSTLEALLDQLVQSHSQLAQSHSQLAQSETRTNSCFQETEKHMSQIAKILERLESQEKLPSQTELDPEENVSVITPRSETVVEPPIQEQKEAEKSLNSDFQVKDDATTKEGSPTPEPEASPYVAQPPFPVRFIEEDKHAKEKENLDVSRKGEVHIPLLEVIREMPRFYAGNDQPGRIKSQQYFEVVLKQLRSQSPRNHQGSVSAQIFQPRPMDKIQEGILISSAYFSQYP
ncbi:hypothetical protein GQ457_06G023300 [Hibiscus cannabinus]